MTDCNSREMPQPKLGAITWLELPTTAATSKAKTFPFYSGLLGWKISPEPIPPVTRNTDMIEGLHMFSDEKTVNGAFLIVSKPEESLFDLPKHGKVGVVVYFTVEGMDEKLATAEELGGRVVVPKTIIPMDGSCFAQVADPDGNTVGMWAAKP